MPEKKIFTVSILYFEEESYVVKAETEGEARELAEARFNKEKPDAGDPYEVSVEEGEP